MRKFKKGTRDENTSQVHALNQHNLVDEIFSVDSCVDIPFEMKYKMAKALRQNIGRRIKCGREREKKKVKSYYPVKGFLLAYEKVSELRFTGILST